MTKLIKNELYKIFHKKILYVLFIITVIFTILSGVIDIIYNNISEDNSFEIAQERIKTYERMGDITSNEYIESKVEYDIQKIIKEKNIKNESAEEYYAKNILYSIIYQYYYALPKNTEKSLKDELKEKMDTAIKKLDDFDWKEVIKDEIKEIKETPCEDKTCEEINKERIKVAEYRLENNIPKTTNNASTTLEVYLSRYKEYLNIKDKNEEVMSYEEKYDKRTLENELLPIQYMLNNKTYTNDYKNNGAKWDLVIQFGEAGTMIAIALLALSSTIVAEEFNKGTIKQLLVKPYSRTKIIISKMIAVLITIMAYKLIASLTVVIIEALFEGDILTIFKQHVIYNFNTSKCISMSYFTEALISYLYSLPEIILLGIFTFAVAVVSTNTALSLGLGFGAYLSSGIFEVLLSRFKFLSFVPTLNYNLTRYMFGNISEYEVLTLSKAIIVDIISFIILFILILVVFNKKDIKNQ